MFDKHYGAKGDPLILVAQGASTAGSIRCPGSGARSTARYSVIQQGRAPSGSSEFRNDLENFFTREALLACVDRDVLSRPPDPALRIHRPFSRSRHRQRSRPPWRRHSRFASGTVSPLPDILHPAQTSPVQSRWASSLSSAGGFLRNYRCATVYGDNFGAGLVRELFQQHAGVSYVSHNVPNKSQIYLAALTYVNSRQCRLFDIPRLLEQAVQLERSPGRDGHDSVDHAFVRRPRRSNKCLCRRGGDGAEARGNRSAAGDHDARLLRPRRPVDQRASRAVAGSGRAAAGAAPPRRERDTDRHRRPPLSSRGWRPGRPCAARAPPIAPPQRARLADFWL